MSVFEKRIHISLKYIFFAVLGVYLSVPVVTYFIGGPLATTGLMNTSSMMALPVLYVLSARNVHGKMYDAVRWVFEAVTSHILIALAFAEVGLLIKDIQLTCGLLGIGMGAMAFMSLVEYLNKWEREGYVEAAASTVSARDA